MWDWWLIRSGEYENVLAATEWEQLAAAGRQWNLAPQQLLAWGPAAGVILVRRGTLYFSAETPRCRHTLELRRGDMVGTLQTLSGLLWAEQPTTLRVFQHHEWLSTLQHLPNVTHKLLQGMAWSALRAEQPLSSPPFAAQYP
jgi:CRP-like cAMP-binding protein